MGGTSEREFLEKITSIKTKSSKRVAEVKKDFAKMQKLKAESLKKTEEMMQSAEHYLEKLEQDMVKSKDLVPESRQRLSVELTATKEHITQKYDDLKKRISGAIVPE
jgi:recombinational DNA repair ATPase RecF